MKAENACRKRLLPEQLLEDDVLGDSLCPAPDRKADKCEWTLGCADSLGLFRTDRCKNAAMIRLAF